MSLKSKPELEQVERASALDALGLKRNLVRILFVHRFRVAVEHCLHELRKSRFSVSSDIAATPEQFAERLRAKPYDLVVAEFPSPDWQETQTLEVLREMKKDIPVIFLVSDLKRETAAKFILGDNLIGFQLALLAENFSSAQPHFQGGKVLPLPIYFDGIGLSIGNGPAKQLRSPSRVLKNLAGEAKRQEFLSRLIAEHPYHRVVDFQKSAVETAAANSVA